VSDNNKVFRTTVFYDFCCKWGIKRINTAPYYPQGSLDKPEFESGTGRFSIISCIKSGKHYSNTEIFKLYTFPHNCDVENNLLG